MKIAVIGAGIVGITTAYELACDGHEVRVWERHAAAAEEASFASGAISPARPVTPWSALGLPGSAVGHWLSGRGGIKLTLPLRASELGWLWQGFLAGQPARWLAQQSQQQRLTLYARARLQQIASTLRLEFERSAGQLLLLRSADAALRVQGAVKQLREAGCVLQQVSPEQARQIEPALSPDTSLFGAIHFPDDEVGNCRQFALLLKAQAQRQGVDFSFNGNVVQVTGGAAPALRLAGELAARSFDAVVVCAGLDSLRLLKPLGLKIPLSGVYGYSVSAMMSEPLNAPRSAVTDEQSNVSIARLGQRVRISGGLELGGTSGKKKDASLDRLYRVLHEWFPGAVAISGGMQEWKGARALLPDGNPLVGASGIAGVWLNLGHGGSGWAQSCGAARVLADLVAGKAPDFDISGLGLARLRAKN